MHKIMFDHLEVLNVKSCIICPLDYRLHFDIEISSKELSIVVVRDDLRTSFIDNFKLIDIADFVS